MKKGKILSLAGGFWEITRLFLLYLIALTRFGGFLETGRAFLLLWLGSSQIVLALLFFSIIFLPAYCRLSVPILLMAKAVSVLSGALFFWASLFSFSSSGLAEGSGIETFLFNLQVNITDRSFLLSGIIFLVDFIFLFSLILYKKSRTEKKGEDQKSLLPDFKETYVEEQ